MSYRKNLSQCSWTNEKGGAMKNMLPLDLSLEQPENFFLDLLPLMDILKLQDALQQIYWKIDLLGTRGKRVLL